MTALLIPAEGEPRLLFDDDRSPTLDEARSAVGGWVERIALPREVLLVNEEGALRRLQANLRATEIVKDRCRRSKVPEIAMPGGLLRGDVILLEGRAKRAWQ